MTMLMEKIFVMPNLCLTFFISNFYKLVEASEESSMAKIKMFFKLVDQHSETISLLPTWFITSFIFFSFAALSFSAGLIGLFFNNKNFLLILLKAELMFLGLNLWFIGFSIYHLHSVGYVYALLLFGLVAAESAMGLSLFLVFFFFKKTISTDMFIYTPEEIRCMNIQNESQRYWEFKKKRSYKELF